MIKLPSSLSYEMHKLSSDGAVLFLLELPELALRYARNTEDVTWGGHTWNKTWWEFDAFSESSDAEQPEVKITLSNIGGMAEQAILDNDSFSGAKCNIYAVHSNCLDESEPICQASVYVQQVTCDRKKVSIKLGADNPLDLLYPAWKIHGNICQYEVFKGELCGYSGTATTCGRTLVDCYTLGNLERAGFQLGILGEIQNDASFGGIIIYMMEDEFDTDAAAGAVDGTYCDPGPGGPRNVTDTESLISVESGYLVFAGGKASPATGDPCLSIEPEVERQGGRVLFIGWTSPSDTSCRYRLGYSETSGAWPEAGGIEVNDSSAPMQVYHADGATAKALGVTVAASTPYEIAVCLRHVAGTFVSEEAFGCMVLIKGGTFAEWTLISISNVSEVLKLFPTFASYDAAFSIDYAKLSNVLWLPQPIASDGFSDTTGDTDGRGHIEGTGSGVGQGGSGVTWNGSTWASSGTDCANGAPSAITDWFRTFDSAAIDVLASVKMTIPASSSVAGLVLNLDDEGTPANCVVAYHDGASTIKLDKIVAGTPTNLISASATYSAGKTIEVRSLLVSGTLTFSLWYNGTKCGANVDVTDAGIIGNTIHGLYSQQSGNLFDDFWLYSRGTDATYDDLEGI